VANLVEQQQQAVATTAVLCQEKQTTRLLNKLSIIKFITYPPENMLVLPPGPCIERRFI